MHNIAKRSEVGKNKIEDEYCKKVILISAKHTYQDDLDKEKKVICNKNWHQFTLNHFSLVENDFIKDMFHPSMS